MAFAGWLSKYGISSEVVAVVNLLLDIAAWLDRDVWSVERLERRLNGDVTLRLTFSGIARPFYGMSAYRDGWRPARYI